MTLRIRTKEDNRQLADDELQFESLRGAISARLVEYDAAKAVKICTVRGIYGRKAQIAVLSEEALAAFIEQLQDLQKKLRG